MENKFFVEFSYRTHIETKASWNIAKGYACSKQFYEKTKNGKPCFTNWKGNYKIYYCLATAQRQCRRLNSGK